MVDRHLHGCITLASLPYDIIRTIIRAEGVSIGPMAQLSRSWNSLVGEYLQERDRYPELDDCSIVTAWKNGIYLDCRVRIVDSQIFKNWANKWNDWKIYKDGIMWIGLGWKLDSKLPEEEIVFCISRCLMRFSSIKRLKIDENTAKSRRIVLKALGKRIRVEEELELLEDSFDYCQREFALQLARRYSPNRLTIVSRKAYNIPNPRDFFAKIPRRIAHIHFHERDYTGPLEKMFGHTESYWEALAHEIVEKSELGLVEVHFRTFRSCFAFTTSPLYTIMQNCDEIFA